MKQKTSKSAKKRFRISASGNIQHRRARMNHFNAKDTGAARRSKKSQASLSKNFEKSVKNLLSYNTSLK